MKVTVYGKDMCTWCDRAVALAESKNLEVTLLKLDKDFTREELLEKFPNARTFPQIMLDDMHLDGFVALNEYLKVFTKD